MEWMPVNYCKSLPFEAIQLNRQVFGDGHKPSYSRASTPETFISDRARNNINDSEAGEDYDEIKEQIVRDRILSDLVVKKWLQNQREVAALVARCSVAEKECFFVWKHLGESLLSETSSSSLTVIPPPKSHTIRRVGPLHPRSPRISNNALPANQTPRRSQYKRILDEALETEVVGMRRAKLEIANLQQHQRQWEERLRPALRRRDRALERMGIDPALGVPAGLVPQQRVEPRVDIAASARMQQEQWRREGRL